MHYIITKLYNIVGTLDAKGLYQESAIVDKILKSFAQYNPPPSADSIYQYIAWLFKKKNIKMQPYMRNYKEISSDLQVLYRDKIELEPNFNWYSDLQKRIEELIQQRTNPRSIKELEKDYQQARQKAKQAIENWVKYTLFQFVGNKINEPYIYNMVNNEVSKIVNARNLIENLPVDMQAAEIKRLMTEAQNRLAPYISGQANR